MKRIHLVGCGAVGCEFIKELSKLCVSQASYIEIDVYDYDEVEERNVCSQSFDYYQIGMNKAEAAAKAFENPYLIVRPHNTKVDLDQLNTFEVNEDTIIVDAVDHLPTRKILWFYGMARRAPVLHLGLSLDKSGVIGWNYGAQNGYVFDFVLMPASQYEKLSNQDIKLLPCELNSFRSIIAGVGVSAAISAANYFGICSAGPLHDWLMTNGIGKVCEKLCAGYRITANSIEFKTKPDSFIIED